MEIGIQQQAPWKTSTPRHVTFRSKLFAPTAVPAFVYGVRSVDDVGLVYSATVHAEGLSEAINMVREVFNDCSILAVSDGVANQSEWLPGHRTRGTVIYIPPPPVPTRWERFVSALLFWK